MRASKKDKAVKEAPTAAPPSFASNREHLNAMSVIASKCASWKPALEVLKPVRAVPTIFPQLDGITRVGGWPIERFGLMHGPSNEGKTGMCHGLGLSFLQRGHFYLYVDAEYTTPEDWLQGIMADFSKHPGFSALRPRTYEQTVDAVREFCETLANAKAKGEIAADTSGLIVVDSLRKLVPKKLMAAIAKGVEDEEAAGPRKGKSRGVDGIGGRAGQLKAAMNAAWLDELVPLLAASGVGMIAVAREAEDPDAGLFDEGFKVGGGTAVYYDSSIVVRVCRDRYLRDGSDDKAKIIGERHLVEIRKTKIGGKTEKRPRAFFHTSNGALFKVGFCRALDVLEAATDESLVDVRGSWYVYGDTKLGQGLNAAAKTLEDTPDLLGEIENKVRESFRLDTAE